MAGNELNVSSSTLTEFLDDLEAKLSMVTGIVNPDDIGIDLVDVRRPMLVIGDPGMGKTCGIISVIDKLNLRLPEDKKLGFKKILLGQTVVGSMSGIPVVKPDGTVVRVQVPDLPDEERDGKYGVLFLDELTTADEAQVQPALGLTDDSRDIGTYTLPDNWIVVAAGNGPNCSNFLRLDDMTISRFAVYNIAFSYEEDWRPYAQEHNIEDNIIAFLNFEPDSCLRMESTLNDEEGVGKLFPCPRSWSRLSTELKMRKALNKEVPVIDMARFAGRIVGLNTARRYQAFCMTADNITVSPEKIVDGTEKDPDPSMKKEVFFMVLQKCTRIINKLLEEDDDGSCNFSAESYQAVANVVNWFLKFQNVDLDATVTAIMSLKNDSARTRSILLDADFSDFSPECDKFFINYGAVIAEQSRKSSLGIDF